MYESTPQHIIDEESAPGPVAAWMDSSSSDDSSSSSSDSDNSRDSNTTAGRIKRVMRGGRRRRKSSSGSIDGAASTRTPSYNASNASPVISDILSEEPSFSPAMASNAPHRFGAIDADEADDEKAHTHRSRTHSFSEKLTEKQQRKKEKKQREREEEREKKQRKREKKERKERKKRAQEHPNTTEPISGDGVNEPRRVDFAIPPSDVAPVDVEAQTIDHVKRPFALRGISIRPAMPSVFTTNPGTAHVGARDASPAVTGPIPRVRYGIRRTNSLPDRLNQVQSNPAPGRAPSGPIQSIPSDPLMTNASNVPNEENISRTTAVVLLLASTALVALCAEFMVSSIDSVTSNTALGETFVGLIILPIVGNAAEHVTAVTVAHKNKMDLAIGVAVGSSIQIGKHRYFPLINKS
jgi:Ca2+:H+ antiporter